MLRGEACTLARETSTSKPRKAFRKQNSRNSTKANSENLPPPHFSLDINFCAFKAAGIRPKEFLHIDLRLFSKRKATQKAAEFQSSVALPLPKKGKRKKIEISPPKEALSDSICLRLPSIKRRRGESRQREKGLITPFNLGWLLLRSVSFDKSGHG